MNLHIFRIILTFLVPSFKFFFNYFFHKLYSFQVKIALLNYFIDISSENLNHQIKNKIK